MNDPLLFVAVLVLTFVIIKMIVARPRMSPAAAHEAINHHGAILIDVREPHEWVHGVAAPAVLLPGSDLRHGRVQWGPFLEQHRDRQLLIYCHSGMRSGAVATALRREGFDAISFGGFSAWANAGLPTRVPPARAA